jgi:protein-S-isoprenylcysteine O-methyltransferase Ste14
MVPYRFIGAVLAAATFIIFMWGVWGVFVAKGEPLRRLTLLKAAAVVSAIAESWAIAVSASVTPVRFLAGSAFFIASLGLFALAVRATRRFRFSLAFSPDLPTRLLRDGPYRWIRHPFYTAYLLAYLAGLVMSANPWLWLVVLGMGWIYLDAARFEERKFAASALAAEHAKYRAEVGMFLPRLRPIARG